MQIRPFSKNDLPSILDIYAKSKLDELINEANIFELLPLEKDAKRFNKLKESDIYVLDNGNVIGYGALFKSEIRAVFVHPEARGKGFGKMLLEFLLSKAQAPAFLYVAKSNVAAKSLYSKFKFRVIDEFETTYNGIPVLANKMALGNQSD